MDIVLDKQRTMKCKKQDIEEVQIKYKKFNEFARSLEMSNFM